VSEDRNELVVDDQDDGTYEVVETFRVNDVVPTPTAMPDLPPELEEFGRELAEIAEGFRNRRALEVKVVVDKVVLNYRAGELLIGTFPDFDRADPNARFPYGAATVKLASEQLGVDPSFLHRCVRFAQKFTREQIENTTRVIPWRAFESMIPVKDDARRIQFLDDYQSGKYENSDKLREHVATYREKRASREQRKADRKPTRQETAAARRRRKIYENIDTTVRTMNAKLTHLGAELLRELNTALTMFLEIHAGAEPETTRTVTEGASGIAKAIGAIRTQFKDVENSAEAVVALEARRDA